jgi:hypothetical protein
MPMGGCALDVASKFVAGVPVSVSLNGEQSWM